MGDGDGIRLVALERDGRNVRVLLSDGEQIELAEASLPPALSVSGAADGQPVLDDALLVELRAASERKRISAEVFRMIDRRLMTRRAILRKLVDKGFSEAAADQVLDLFAEQGLLSDRLFAEAWCRDALRTRAVGRRYLTAKLREKGIEAALADRVAAEQLDPDLERDLADRAADRWWSRQRGAVDRRLLAKGMRHLQGKGFAASLAGDAIRRGAPTREEES